MDRHTFQEEETVYSQEQIRFEHIHFIDNQPVVDLIESKVRSLYVHRDGVLLYRIDGMAAQDGTLLVVLLAFLKAAFFFSIQYNIDGRVNELRRRCFVFVSVDGIIVQTFGSAPEL